MSKPQGFTELASVDEARQTLLEIAPQVSNVLVPLGDALHRVLAMDVRSSIDVPHFQRSLMDGYAVRAADTPGTLKLFGDVTPGRPANETLMSGQCFSITTGSPVPDGADAVVMVEKTSMDGDRVVAEEVSVGENVLPAGSDFQTGDVIAVRGTRLQPRHLGVLAAAGIDQVCVAEKLAVSLISSGPELRRAGTSLDEASVYDINSHTLAASLLQDGCQLISFDLIGDDPAFLDETLRAALEKSDLVLISGGSSVGAVDHVPDAIASLGKLLIHGVALKPGKPIAIGAVDSKVIMGLPGNPMSALVGYLVFVRPMIGASSGLREQERERSGDYLLTNHHGSPASRHELVPVTLRDGNATPVSKGSFSISGLGRAHGYFEVGLGVREVRKGTLVRVTYL